MKFLKKIKFKWLFPLLLTACHPYSPSLTSINLIDRNGLSETISGKDRLLAFEKTDFLSPQPYQKVMLVYKRDQKGDIPSQITSYHPNGQIKQFLETVNNRAFGSYKEWHPNGKLKINSNVIGGIADLNTLAEESWLFDGENKVWDESGNEIASIRYEKGMLEGPSFYYHANGSIWRENHFEKNLMKGEQKTFLEDGSLLLSIHYQKGLKHGPSIRYWSPTQVAFEEYYEEGKLLKAQYFSNTNSLIASVNNGNGFKAIFGKTHLLELQEFKNGYQEGLVKTFDECGSLLSTHTIKNETKEGEEIYYFSHSSKPKLSLYWKEGVLSGPIKTWYENHIQESQKEMVDNKKNGLLTAWYANGDLMLVEEYENDALVRGEYYRLGEKTPISKIENGNGVATLFDSVGKGCQKINYRDSKPQEFLN